MSECIGNNFILNGALLPAEHFNNSLIYEGDSVYEVIRLLNGSPIFFSDHMERLLKSVKLEGKEPLADTKILGNAIKALVLTEGKQSTNLKVVFNYSESVRNFLVYFIETSYPTSFQYKNGVKGILYFAERRNPGSKIINHKLRSSISQRLILDNAYEAILVNETGFITEGSRSNIFFMKNDVMITAPDDMILCGITRKHILDICDENKIRVEYDCVKADELRNYNGAVMTGTSPMVLPYSQIGDIEFNVKIPVIEHIRNLYIEKAEASIDQFMSLHQTEK